jgi:hypothetical protein
MGKVALIEMPWDCARKFDDWLKTGEHELMF